jgi:prephenate dehydrogenase
VKFNRVAILGVGLIGASFARALKKRSLSVHACGYGRTENNLKRAKEEGIIDSYDTDPVRACDGADLVVFATPVGRFTTLSEEVSGAIAKGALVIDVGGMKVPVVYRMEKTMPNFVGCHPIAGSERSGIDDSNADLFEGSLCVVTKTEKTDSVALDNVSGLWRELGSRVVVMEPEEHDRIYGIVSHFAHLAAYALVNTAADAEKDILDYAGRGFKDMTRIAMSSPALWRDICFMNKQNILETIEAYKTQLERMARHLKEDDAEGLEKAFEKARTKRKDIDN